MDGADGCELTILMPCLNEAETVSICVGKAVGWLQDHGVHGEVIVADNGSTDGSQALASAAGARVVDVLERGYGAALRGGIAAARGRYVVMGDADDSYDFTALEPFVAALRVGADLVMGNRFKGGIAPGAMPWLHRYVGNPVLSYVGRRFFRIGIGDFHCGLRGFRRDPVIALGLSTSGMEFASEMVVRSALDGLRIAEVPTALRPDGRSRPPHLRTWSDGWRHLRFLLLFSPRWLFLIPGLAAVLVGGAAAGVLTFTDVRLGSTTFSVGTLIYCAALVLIGVQSVSFALFTKIVAITRGFLPRDGRIERFSRWFRLERGLLVGFVVLLAGIATAVVSLSRWRASGFGDLDTAQQVRVVLPGALGLVIGSGVLLSSFFLSMLGLGAGPETRTDSLSGPS